MGTGAVAGLCNQCVDGVWMNACVHSVVRSWERILTVMKS